MVPIFTTSQSSDLQVMDIVASGSLRCFFWHLAKSNQTNGYGDINFQENSGGGGAAAAAGGTQVLKKLSFLLMSPFFHLYFNIS